MSHVSETNHYSADRHRRHLQCRRTRNLRPVNWLCRMVDVSAETRPRWRPDTLTSHPARRARWKWDPSTWNGPPRQTSDVRTGLYHPRNLYRDFQIFHAGLWARRGSWTQWRVVGLYHPQTRWTGQRQRLWSVWTPSDGSRCTGLNTDVIKCK